MKDLYEMLYKLMKLVDKYALFMPYQADELKRINEIREQIAKIESEGLGIMED